MPMIKQSAITGIDHTLIGVRDLEAARTAWARLGLQITPRGRHIGWGTANYCIMLERGYIELLGIVDPAQFTNNLDKFLEQREGLLGLAFNSRDADATAAWLKAQGLHPEGPRDLKRALEMPDGDLMPAFKLVHLPPEETPGLRAFFCQHLTPDIVRGRGWIIHALRAVSVESVVSVVADPAAVAPAYRKLFGDDAVSTQGWRCDRPHRRRAARIHDRVAAAGLLSRYRDSGYRAALVRGDADRRADPRGCSRLPGGARA